jgi:demethylmenaquinone methyltransferase/2-methoxy-6-polyprenyl-1,4-benzoquinol methylase
VWDDWATIGHGPRHDRSGVRTGGGSAWSIGGRPVVVNGFLNPQARFVVQLRAYDSGVTDRPVGNTAATPQVAAMFDALARRYDAMNSLISGFQEPRWRRRLVDAATLQAGMSALDVACGTGKVTADLAERVGPFGRVVGVDVAGGMIDLATSRYRDRVELEFVVADAMALPLEDGSFDAATIAFGMRNLPDYRQGFAEMTRCVRRGGRVLCLEIARPRSIVGRLGRVWFERVVPLLGALAGQGDAYRYLVESVRRYPPPEAIAELMRGAGLVDVRWRPMLFGMVTLHEGVRPAV